MKSSLTIADLKKAIKDLPDDLPVYAANPVGSPRLDDCYYLTKVFFSPNSNISNPFLNLELGDEFGF